MNRMVIWINLHCDIYLIENMIKLCLEMTFTKHFIVGIMQFLSVVLNLSGTHTKTNASECDNGRYRQKITTTF